MTKRLKNRGRPLTGTALRERVSFTLSPELHKYLTAEARKLQLSKSELVEKKISGKIKYDQISALVTYAKIQRKFAEIAEQNGIKKLSLFGSITKGTTTEQSDIDVLVEFKETSAPGLFQLAKIENELSQALDGNKVDLRTIEDLSKYFQSEVKESAITIYEGV